MQVKKFHVAQLFGQVFDYAFKMGNQFPKLRDFEKTTQVPHLLRSAILRSEYVYLNSPKPLRRATGGGGFGRRPRAFCLWSACRRGCGRSPFRGLCSRLRGWIPRGSSGTPPCPSNSGEWLSAIPSLRRRASMKTPRIRKGSRA